MSGIDSVPGGSNLVDASGKIRTGWGLVEAPEVKPTDPGKMVDAPKFGDVDMPPPITGVPTDIKVSTEAPTKYDSMPAPQPIPAVTFAEPEKVSYPEKTIEVAGAGMGSYKKYTMLESEALAVYTIIRDNKGSISPEGLKAKLKERYGIDADVTTVDGHIALVNKATGNAIAVDTEGNGALGFEDLQFKTALLAAGIDPDRKKPHFNPFDLAMSVITEANEASKKRNQENEAIVAKRAAAQTGGGTSGNPGIATPGVPAAPGTTGPAPTSSSPPPSTVTGGQSSY